MWMHNISICHFRAAKLKGARPAGECLPSLYSETFFEPLDPLGLAGLMPVKYHMEEEDANVNDSHCNPHSNMAPVQMSVISDVIYSFRTWSLASKIFFLLRLTLNSSLASASRWDIRTVNCRGSPLTTRESASSTKPRNFITSLLTNCSR